MFTHSLEGNVFPCTLYEVNISLLPKEGRDETELSSFRPNASINVDMKIFTKILANRLKKPITSIIHADQTGFVPNSFFYVRRLINIINHKYDKCSKVAALRLDMEKAFDQSEWGYMLRALEDFGFGPWFVSWIKLLYTQLSSSILTHQEGQPPFHFTVVLDRAVLSAPCYFK